MKNQYKSILLIMFISILSFNVSAASKIEDKLNAIDTTKLSKEQIYRDGKLATQYLVGQADSILQKSSAIVSKASENVWDILVDQQRVYALGYLAAILVYLYLVYIYKNTVINFYNKTQLTEDTTYTNTQLGVIVIGGILIIGLGIFNIYHFTTMLTGFLNPRYSALKELIELGGDIVNRVK